MSADLLTFLKELTEIPAPSSLEEPVRRYLIERLMPAADKLYTDRVGNLYCLRSGKTSLNAPVLLAAHMDEVGLMVNEVRDNGTLKFGTVGGIEAGILPAKRVLFPQKENLRGVIGAKPIHLYKDREELEQPVERKSLAIDIGAKDKDDAKKFVNVGDIAAFDRDYYPWLETEYKIRSIALDDRVGCALLLDLALRQTLPCDILFAFTVKEECGLRGASVLSHTESYCAAIAVEGTTASDLPKAEGTDAVCFQGEGGVLSVADRGTIYDTALVRAFLDLARENAVPCQIKLRVAGGNEAAAYQRYGGAKKVLAFSAPCRYIHSPVSTVDKRDLHSMKTLLPLFAAYLGQHFGGSQ